MAFFSARISKLWRTVNLLIAFTCGILFLILLFGYPHLDNTLKANLLLQKRLDDVKVALDECQVQHNRKQAVPKDRVTTKKQNKIIKGINFLWLVHLDLKGAPPKFSYLMQVLPLLKKLGANGLLVEYEDMFPYKGALRNLASSFAYSPQEISSFLSEAKRLQLEVIPLVQTFGHFEFVLKHHEYRDLRETPEYPNMPCPLKPKTMELIKKMLDQVLQLHPDISRIHVGGDEVFNIKDCSACKASEMTKNDLFLHHMLAILRHVRWNTDVVPIIWDDMLRSSPLQQIKELGELSEVMVWAYGPKINFPTEMWDRYSEAFPGIWLASSFKGAISAGNNIVPIPMHISNHVSWLKAAQHLNKVKGIAIAGWARYDHFATLCELLPQALPSLGMVLAVLKDGQLTSQAKEKVESLLLFSNPVILEKDPFGSWDTSVPGYPGGEIYSLVAEYENHVNWYLDTKRRLDSWANERQVNERYVSLLHVRAVSDTLKQLLPSFGNFRKKCFKKMELYFFSNAIEEWVSDKVDTYIKLSQQLQHRLYRIKHDLLID